MRDCVLFLQLGAGTGRGREARARCALSIDVFNLEVVSGAASAYTYWVVGFWEAETSFRICSVLCLAG